MELTQLTQFVAAARAESITTAAKSLYISQPALSNSIARLEKELGFKLFDRHGNQVCLNKSGSIFLNYTEQSIKLLSDGIQCLRDYNGSQTFEVEYSIPHGGLFSSIRCQYMLNNLDTSFHQHCCTAKEAQDKLLAGLLDFVITFLPLDDPRIQWTPIAETRLEVQMNRFNPLASAGSIHPSMLENQIFISNISSWDLMQILSDCCVKYNFLPKVFFSGDEPLFQNALLAERNALMVIPDLIWRLKPTDYDAQIGRESPNAVLPIADESCRATVGIAKLRDSAMSGPARMFYDHLCSVIPESV